MARLKNIGDNDVTLYATPGEASAYPVEAAQTVEVPGEVIGEADGGPDDDADFYLIGDPNDLPSARAWPKSHWLLADDDEPKARSTTRRSATTKNEGE